MPQLALRAAVLTRHTASQPAAPVSRPQVQGQAIAQAKLGAERAALSRLDKMKSDQGARVSALAREAAASELCASLIEYNLEAVDAAIDAVNAGAAAQPRPRDCVHACIATGVAGSVAPCMQQPATSCVCETCLRVRSHCDRHGLA